MKQNQTNRSSRRKFLSLGLLGAAGLVTKKVDAMAQSPEEDEKVPMMTRDGKLVEVSKKILLQSTSREKARHLDILKWRDIDHKPKT